MNLADTFILVHTEKYDNDIKIIKSKAKLYKFNKINMIYIN